MKHSRLRIKQLEEDSRRQRRIMARQALELDAMKDLVEKNGWGLAANGSREDVARTRNVAPHSTPADRRESKRLLLRA